jgi:hypothetical protein
MWEDAVDDVLFATVPAGSLSGTPVCSRTDGALTGCGQANPLYAGLAEIRDAARQCVASNNYRTCARLAYRATRRDSRVSTSSTTWTLPAPQHGSASPLSLCASTGAAQSRAIPGARHMLAAHPGWLPATVDT